MAEEVASEDAARDLAARILGSRSRPLVVVSTAPDTDAVALDIDQLIAEIADFAELVIIRTGDTTHALSAMLPARTQVYGGAGRSYPVDFGHDPDIRRSPLRFPGGRATEQLIGDVLAQANTAGLFSRPRPRSARVTGVVTGFVAEGSRAFVTVTGHGPATVARELTLPPFPLEWTLSPRQRIAGTLDLGTRRFMVDTVSPTPADLAARFPHLSVTLAFVSSVAASSASLLLHPGSAPIVVQTSDVSPNALDSIDLLLAEGDVVAVRVIHLSDRLHLRLSDVDDDERVLPAMPATVGGPPWLIQGRALVTAPEVFSQDVEVSSAPISAAPPTPSKPVADEPAVAPVVSAPRPLPGPGLRPAAVPAPAPEPASIPPSRGTGSALQSAQLRLAADEARIAALEEQVRSAARVREAQRSTETRLHDVLAELGVAERRIRDLEADHRQSTRALREARRASTVVGPAQTDRAERRLRWSTDDDWLRHEVYLVWVERISATERAEWPLRDYVIGPDFVGSLAMLDDGQFDKAMRAVVDAVTGRIGQIAGREAHMLRTGDGASDPVHQRSSDGARCWRAYIEHKTAAARRLHYWVVPGAGVELSRIVSHDDMQP